ncbi:MAG: hypothetical protein ACE363_13510 [Alphaproteobacteria bacterium]
MVSDAAFLHQPAQDKNETYDVNRLNQYTQIAGVSLTYDANGNMTQYDFGAGIHTYTYDAENKLAAAVTPDHIVTYGYDGAGAARLERRGRHHHRISVGRGGRDRRI